MPTVANAAAKDWRQVLLDQDRYLSLERAGTSEKAYFLYYRHGQGFDRQGYATACHLLRDVHSGVTTRINPKLIDLLYLIQTWLKLNNYSYHIIINSGYRTPTYNKTLRGAARESEHVKGNAADIKIPGVNVRVIQRLAKKIGVGGVGVYVSKGFVHLDVGRVREWAG